MPARAEPLVAFYEVSWGSLPAATLVLSLATDGADYRDALRIQTVGVPRFLLGLRADIATAGKFGADGMAHPANYAVNYDSRRFRDQHIRIAFVVRDGRTVAERTIDDSSNKPPLDESYRRDVIDPLSALAAVRERLRQNRAKAGDHFTLPVFDDVRRFDVAVSVVAIDGPGNLIRIHLDLRPIAGFKRRKNNRDDPEDAPRPMELTLTDDARLLPQSFEVSVAWLPLVVRFDRLCADVTHCEAVRR
jgi:hypothetical protein